MEFTWAHNTTNLIVLGEGADAIVCASAIGVEMTARYYAEVQKRHPGRKLTIVVQPHYDSQGRHI